MRIRAKTFRAWMQANFTKRELKELVEHGADAGWQGLTYYTDTRKLYERFKEEIWEALCNDTETLGYRTVLEFLADFHNAHHVVDAASFETLLVWYMAELTAQKLLGEEER